MNKANDISEELRSMGSVLADIPHIMPYSVPEGFFENFAGSIKVTNKELPEKELIPDWGKGMPYSTPENYFKELTGKIVANVTDNDISQSLPKELPFKVPAGYFDNLPAQLLMAAKTASPVLKETKLIPLKRQDLFRRVRWVAAAILILGIGFGSYKIINSQPSKTENMLASVPNNDIQEYVQYIYRMDANRIVSNTDINNLQLDNKDIIQYLNETGWD